MNDPVPAPEIQTPPEFQFYVQQNGIQKTQREFERDSIPGLQKSLSKAHDNLQRQVRINTQMYAEIVHLKKRLGSKWKGILVTALISAGTAFAWEVGMLFAPMVLRYFGLN